MGVRAGGLPNTLRNSCGGPGGWFTQHIEELLWGSGRVVYPTHCNVGPFFSIKTKHKIFFYLFILIISSNFQVTFSIKIYAYNN